MLELFKSLSYASLSLLMTTHTMSLFNDQHKCHKKLCFLKGIKTSYTHTNIWTDNCGILILSHTFDLCEPSNSSSSSSEKSDYKNIQILKGVTMGQSHTSESVDSSADCSNKPFVCWKNTPTAMYWYTNTMTNIMNGIHHSPYKDNSTNACTVKHKLC